MEQLLNVVMGVLVGIPSYLFGGWSSVLTMLTVMLVIELITGVAKGSKNRNLDSRIFRHGLIMKGSIFIVIILAHFADNIAGTGNALVTVAVMYYVGVEGVSIIENLAQIGVPVPEAITKRFKKLKDDGDKEVKDDPERPVNDDKHSEK